MASNLEVDLLSANCNVKEIAPVPRHRQREEAPVLTGLVDEMGGHRLDH
jgi:hypothetical protein